MVGEPRKVLFLISSLHGGGAERVFLHLLRNLDRTRFSPHLVLFEKQGELLSELPRDVPVEALVAGRRAGRVFGTVILQLAWRFAAVLARERPDAVLSFMWYPNAMALLGRMFARNRCRVVVSERYGLIGSREGWFVELIRRSAMRLLYPKADGIVVNAKAMGEQLRRVVPLSESRLRVIHNPVDLASLAKACEEDVDEPWFQEDVPIVIGAGRLTEQKNFPLLIRAVGRLAREGRNCRVAILGRGTERDRLAQFAEELGLGERVALLGFRPNPYKYIKRSSVFVLSSRYEGFPNVLLEAMALGIPSVATRCPTGPDEIITDGVDGLLVPNGDENALTDAIRTLLVDATLRARLAAQAAVRARDFAVERVARQYEECLTGESDASPE